MAEWRIAGLAAGFDKNAEAMEGLLGLGFGFIEVGESALGVPVYLSSLSYLRQAA